MSKPGLTSTADVTQDARPALTRYTGTWVRAWVFVKHAKPMVISEIDSDAVRAQAEKDFAILQSHVRFDIVSDVRHVAVPINDRVPA